ncbi:MAG: class I SAM-dependent methyltransferase [Patescibacteria group bacterium]|nr:class I SAM-dependent methyltransferase [Patescibacteria group bacterium]
MTKWERFFDEKIKEIAKEKVIRDIGGGSPFQKDLAKYKEYFKDSDYKTLDYNPDYNPDILGNVYNLPFENESIDAIICKAVLQHVYDPKRAVSEIYRVLKKGGKCFVYAPFLYAYHGDDSNKDYYRYTRDGVEYLLQDFGTIEICPIRGYFETLANFLPYQNKFPINILAILARFLDGVSENYQNKMQVSGFNIFLVK